MGARLLRRALLAAALAAGISAGPAGAHAYLLGSDPAAGVSLGGAPRTLTLRFDEPVSPALTRVRLVGDRSGAIRLPAATSGGTATLAVRLPRLAPDLYRVDWRTVAEIDLHPTAGTFAFRVGAGAPLAAGAAEQRLATGSAAPGEVALRWLDFAAFSVLLGALGVLLIVVPRTERLGFSGLDVLDAPLALLALAGSLAALATGAALLLEQAGRAGGAVGPGGAVWRTSFGRHWLERELLLLALAGLTAALARAPRRRRLRLAAGACAVTLTAPLALASHAASIDGQWSPATLVMGLHLLAAALWAGGVVALALSLTLLARRGTRLPAWGLARSFAGYAAVTVAGIALTGLWSLGVHVRSLDALLHTAYGQTVLVKTALFGLAGVLGLVTTLALRTRLQLGWTSVCRLEAVVVVAALVPAAVLTASAPAREPAQTVPRAVATPVRSFASVRDLLVSLTVEPNLPGRNFVTVSVVNTRRPAPAPIGGVTVRLAQPGAAVRSVSLRAIGGLRWQTVTRLGRGRVRASVGVQRPHLRVASTAHAWTVPPAAVAATAAPQPGFPRRPLAPVLQPVAAALAAALLALLMTVAVVRRRSARTRPSHNRGDLRVRQVEP